MNLLKRSTIPDLYNIINNLNLTNTIICAKPDLPKYLKNKKIHNIIFNMSNDRLNGTHWVFYSPKYKVYFDTYAQKPPSIIPRNTKLASINKEVQSMNSSDCGQLCCLFAYYLNNKTIFEFYKLFKDVYK